MKKIYISGKISGLPRERVLARFKEVEDFLRSEGYIPLNPTYLPPGMEWEDYMFIDLATLDRCDSIFMLDGWEQSKGAKMERRFAKEKNKNIIYECEYMSKSLSEQIRNDL